MYKSVIVTVWFVGVFGSPPEYFLPLSDLYQTEYAPTYDNYEPHDYHFEYAVSDPHTGDHKSQWEVKEKGVVRGMYSLLEPDGTTRVVEYIADDNGFRATVKKLGTPIHHQIVEAQPIPLPEAFGSNYGGVYSGQVENYVLGQEHPLTHLSTDEVHGFTGNLDDDSGYTDFSRGQLGGGEVTGGQLGGGQLIGGLGGGQLAGGHLGQLVGGLDGGQLAGGHLGSGIALQGGNVGSGGGHHAYVYISDHNIGHGHNYIELPRPEIVVPWYQPHQHQPQPFIVHGGF